MPVTKIRSAKISFFLLASPIISAVLAEFRGLKKYFKIFPNSASTFAAWETPIPMSAGGFPAGSRRLGLFLPASQAGLLS